MLKNVLLLPILALIFLSCDGCPKKDVKAEKSVFFIEPKDNAKVKSPFLVKFGLFGIKVRPEQENIDDAITGYHHLLIDNEKGFIEKGQVIPKDDRHIHIDEGEDSTIINLPRGTHKLTLQYGDEAHLSYGKEMASTITVIVE